MNISDFNLGDFQSNTEFDLCIVGGGAAGLSIAKEFLNTKINVIVIESGGFESEAQTQALNDIEAPNNYRSTKQDYLRRRALGGSSRIWAGRCAPLDEIDFEQRDWIPHSGWPIGLTELEPFYRRAGEILGLGPHCYDDRLWPEFNVEAPRPPLDERVLKSMFWQFSRSPRRPRAPVDFGNDIATLEAPNVHVLLHANVVHINTNIDGTRFESVDIASLNGNRARIKSKVLVLCCGGIENARLLLASNRTSPAGLGNAFDVVGRYLTDQIEFTISVLTPDRARFVWERFGGYWLDDASGRHVFLHGMGLSAALQTAQASLNCHAYLDQFYGDEDDPWLAMKRAVGAYRSRDVSTDTFRDVLLAVGGWPDIARAVYDRVYKRRPPHLRGGRIELRATLEQAPDPECRITLSPDKRDALGVPLSVVSWKTGEIERRTAQALCHSIKNEFRRLGLPSPEPPDWLDDAADWPLRSFEKANPSGATRMSTDPAHGVVDPNCEVHGVRGLFISGNSVFPTAGAANPMLTVVALSLRLADYLKSRHFEGGAPPSP